MFASNKKQDRMKYMKKIVFASLLVLSLLVPFSSEGFILNLLKDVTVVCSALTQMNQVNRKLVYNMVAGGSQQGTLDDDFLIMLNEAEDDNGQLMKRSISLFPELAGDLPPEVGEIIGFLQESPKYAAMGAKMPRGILLTGPPGTGKTSIARAIAHQANASFFHASGSEFVEVYVGVGPQRVRDLFDSARNSLRLGQTKTAIIFIDEIDAIGGKRSNLDNSEYHNTLNELLNQMDGFNQDPRVVVIAATNKPDSLDSALKRPGRFDRIVEIGLPNQENRKKILMFYCSRIKMNIFNDPLDFDVLAENTLGMSPAELKNLVNEAAIHAVRQNNSYVSMHNFDAVIKAVRRHRK